MSALYNITEQYRGLVALANESDEDMAEALADTFEAIEGDFNNKAIALITVAKNIDTFIDPIDVEIKRLQARKKAIKNKTDLMRNYLRENMEATGITKIECSLFTISIRKPTKVVNILDVEKIPTDYIDYKTTSSPMKRELLAALKAGEEIEGVSIGLGKSSLTIK